MMKVYLRTKTTTDSVSVWAGWVSSRSLRNLHVWKTASAYINSKHKIHKWAFASADTPVDFKLALDAVRQELLDLGPGWNPIDPHTFLHIWDRCQHRNSPRTTDKEVRTALLGEHDLNEDLPAKVIEPQEGPTDPLEIKVQHLSYIRLEGES